MLYIARICRWQRAISRLFAEFIRTVWPPTPENKIFEALRKVLLLKVADDFEERVMESSDVNNLNFLFILKNLIDDALNAPDYAIFNGLRAIAGLMCASDACQMKLDQFFCRNSDRQAHLAQVKQRRKTIYTSKHLSGRDGLTNGRFWIAVQHAAFRIIAIPLNHDC